MATLRGRPIRSDGGRWVYIDTGLPCADTWRERSCGQCELSNRADGHDACLGELPDVANACCGHGDARQAYVQFDNGSTLRGQSALAWMRRQRK